MVRNYDGKGAFPILDNAALAITTNWQPVRDSAGSATTTLTVTGNASQTIAISDGTTNAGSGLATVQNAKLIRSLLSGVNAGTVAGTLSYGFNFTDNALKR
jgi:hypothetical protein